jgi:hypothetical protein
MLQTGKLFPRVGFLGTNPAWRSKRVVRFCNGRGTAEQWIKEGKNVMKWAKLSCRTFKDNQTRLQLFVSAYNLANFLWRPTVPKSVSKWTLTTLREELIKIRAKMARHSKQVTFQLAEVAVPRVLFAAILQWIKRLAMPPPSVARTFASHGGSGTGLTNWEKPRSATGQSSLRSPSRVVAKDFRANENGCRPPRTRGDARHGGGGLVRWMNKRAWVSSRLTANGKCRINLQAQYITFTGRG